MLQLRDIMTTDVVTLSPDTTVRGAMELLTERHISGAPVVAREKVVGVVSATDLLEFAASASDLKPTDREQRAGWDEWADPPDWEAGDDPSARFLAELWTGAHTDVTEPAAELENSAWDVLAEHAVGEVMTRRLCSLPPTADVAAAADYMRTANVHRILVMDGDRLVGIVSALDVARAVADRRITRRKYVFSLSERLNGRPAAEF